jgi:lambda family phage tail tape measure protein
MADTTYKVNVDTRGAISAIDGLKAALGGLAVAFATREFVQITKTFEDLRITLQILYKDVQKGNAVFADIKRFAATSSFSVNDLTETVIKLRSAGLNPTINQLRFFAEVSAVAADKVGALRAITDLYARTTAGGLGLEDLNRLADRGIPVFTILKDTLGINRLEITKLGQSAKGAQIILKALEQGLSDAFAGGSDLRAKSLSQATSNLRDSFNNLIDSMGQEGGLNSALANLANAMAKLLDSARPLAVMISQALAPAINGLAKVLNPLLPILMALGVYLAGGFAIGLLITTGRILQLAAGFAFLNKTIMLLVRNPYMLLFASTLAVITMSMDKTKETLDDLDKKMKELGGLDQGDVVGGVENLRGQIQGLNPEIDKLNAKYKVQTDELRRYTGELFDRFGFQARMIGKLDDEVELQTELNNEYKRFSDQIQELKNRQTELRGQMINETDTSKVAAYSHEIDLVNQLIKDATKSHEENNQQITYGINLVQSQRAAEEDRKRNLELISAELQRQADIQGKLRDIILDAQDKLAEEQYKRSRLPGLAGQITDIQRANRMAAESAARSFADMFNLEDMTSQDAERFREGLNRIAESYGRISEIQIEQLEYSRTWASGWDEAFERYRESAYDAANQAKSYFDTFTRGFEDAIVRFVQTGKLSFKDLITTMLAQFARVQASRMFMNFLGASGTGGFFRNLFGGGSAAGSSILGLPGFARGGYLPSGQMGIVGEQGPELITGPANITPFEQSKPMNITYNINAVDAQSFRSLVARDPQFIYSVTEAGRRSQPGRRLA